MNKKMTQINIYIYIYIYMYVYNGGCPGEVIQSMTVLLMFASWNDARSVFEESEIEFEVRDKRAL